MSLNWSDKNALVKELRLKEGLRIRDAVVKANRLLSFIRSSNRISSINNIFGRK